MASLSFTNSASPSSAVILLIDNDPLMLTGMAAILDMNGHECHCARDAEATIKALQRLDLDLIICNVDFDGNSIPAIYQRLLRYGAARDVPLIVISGTPPQSVLSRSLAGGTTYFLEKPVQPERLLAQVGNALWLPHLVRQHAQGGGERREEAAQRATVETPAASAVKEINASSGGSRVTSSPSNAVRDAAKSRLPLLADNPIHVAAGASRGASAR